MWIVKCISPAVLACENEYFQQRPIQVVAQDDDGRRTQVFRMSTETALTLWGQLHGALAEHRAWACAVVGCVKEGKPHICPYDNQLHRHGRVHYDCECPVSSLTFKKDDWYLLCDEHYAHVSKERSEWVTSRAARMARPE